MCGLLGPYGLFYAYFYQTAKRLGSQSRELWKALAYFDLPENSNNVGILQSIIDRGSFKHLGIEKGCFKVIELARDDRLLRKMFPGWQAYV